MRQRIGTNDIYVRVTNLIGDYLKNLPGVEVTVKQVHFDLNFHYSKEKYTQNQIRRSLEWQAENNKEHVKTKMTGLQNRTRVFWYEPTSDI